MKQHSPNLYLSQNCVFYFRIAVPKEARFALGCAEIKKSLSTRDHREARLEAEMYRLYFSRYFARITRGMNNNNNLNPVINYVANGKLCSVSPETARGQLERLYLLQSIYAQGLTPELLASSTHASTSTEKRPALDLPPSVQALPPAEVTKAISAIEAAVDTLTEIAERFNRLNEVMGRAQSSPSNQPPPLNAPVGTQQVTSPQEGAETYTISDLIKDYSRSQVRENKWTEHTQEKNQPKLGLLVEILGDPELATVNRSAARAVQSLLQKLPPNKHKDKSLDGLPIKDVAKLTHKKLLSPKTVNNHIDQYKALFRWAILEEKYAGNNPFEGLRVKDYIKDDQRREDFSMADLSRIFKHPIFTDYGSDRHDRPSRYWGTLLGATSGARVNEIMCLELNNITLEGIPHIHITAGDETSTLGSSKSVKNEYSIRKVPIHPKLLELGFADYVKRMKRKGETLLFPEAAEGKVRPGDKLGSWFNETLKKHIGMGKGYEKKVFHSFRHTIATMLYEFGCDAIAIEQLTGHSVGNKTVGQAVYTHPKLENLNEQLANLDISFLENVKAFSI